MNSNAAIHQYEIYRTALTLHLLGHIIGTFVRILFLIKFILALLLKPFNFIKEKHGI